MSLKAFAASLGLSKTTVSRALDGYGDVAPETRRRVREAAAAVGYRPNPAARRLSRGSTGLVALVVPATAERRYEPVFIELAAAIGTGLADHQLDLTLLAARPGEPELAAYERIVDGGRADAVVVVRTRVADERVVFLQQRGIPFVCFGRTAADAAFAYVDGDGEAAFRAVTEHLVWLGHRRFAYLGAPVGAAASIRRRAGMLAALDAAKLSPVALLEDHSNEEAGHAMARRLLIPPMHPTVLVCATDRVAVGALRAVREARLRPGIDVSIIGHDNLPITAFTDPPLATMEVPLDAAGTRIAEILVALIGGADPAGFQEVLPVKPIWRASVGPPAVTMPG